MCLFFCLAFVVSGKEIYLLSLIVVEVVEVCVQESACLFVSWGLCHFVIPEIWCLSVSGLLPRVVDALSALINSKV